MDETKKGFMQNIGDLSFKKIDDTNFEKPFGMVATVYKYTNLKNGRIYIGIHLESHKPYHTSSKDEDFLKDKAERGAQFKFEILDWGSFEECEDIENNLLEYSKSF